MEAKLTRLPHKIAIQLRLVSGRELYHLQYSIQVASPETFGYTLVDCMTTWLSKLKSTKKCYWW